MWKRIWIVFLQPLGTAAYPICGFVYSFSSLSSFIYFFPTVPPPNHTPFFMVSGIILPIIHTVSQINGTTFFFIGSERHPFQQVESTTCPIRIFVTTCLRFLPFDFFLATCHLDDLLRGSGLFHPNPSPPYYCAFIYKNFSFNILFFLLLTFDESLSITIALKLNFCLLPSFVFPKH